MHSTERKVGATLSFLRRFPNGHQPKAPERLVIVPIPKGRFAKRRNNKRF